ncbi:uncharacterized protein A4U43_C08F14010 [Asparagus officinalis]|uniref:uncharacterized protein LOC109820426 n=1 Tax=Asparagus officinalis TaxID=4686 RepID=UPI00098E47D0|nr:uncharacterized protein LOC109820426 [Asparagus officinalis]ONK60084.1 uncharacterized protein A4U43_C08F14010 [Asparagus officinalis]
MQRVLPQCRVPSSELPPPLRFKRNGRIQFKVTPITAKRSSNGEKKSQTNESSLFSTLKISRALAVKSATVIFGLGFVDAGYSGDWSRIGVISKETEELLKMAAYGIVPLCVLVASFISDEE